MRQRLRMTAGLLLAALLAACSQSRPAAESDAAQPADDGSASLPTAGMPGPAPAVTGSAVPAPDAPAGNMIAYACDDGSGVTVTYDEYTALVKLPSGSTMLSRAEAASGGGTDAYLGEELSLYRNGDLVQVQVAGKTRTCSQS